MFQQINITHPHTAGGWASYNQSTTITDGSATMIRSSGYKIPTRPPRCFDATHNPIRTRSELLPSNTFKLKRHDPGHALSSSTRSPTYSFVESTTAQLIPGQDAQVPGPGKYEPFHHQDKKKGKVGLSFTRAKKKTGDRWTSTTGNMPGVSGSFC
jgi:hypothetical protein